MVNEERPDRASGGAVRETKKDPDKRRILLLTST
jgi:hypothetical protein